jgi:hypothetical protein
VYQAPERAERKILFYQVRNSPGSVNQVTACLRSGKLETSHLRNTTQDSRMTQIRQMRVVDAINRNEHVVPQKKK